jgi:hypothetical protein
MTRKESGPGVVSTGARKDFVRDTERDLSIPGVFKNPALAPTPEELDRASELVGKIYAAVPAGTPQLTTASALAYAMFGVIGVTYGLSGRQAAELCARKIMTYASVRWS